MHEKQGHFDNIKQEAIEKAKAGGVSDPKELDRIGEKAKMAKIEKVGAASERRYLRYIKEYKRVRVRVENTLKCALEDAYDGIDFWEEYDPALKLVDLPVQIKSGKGDVEAFRKDPRYLKRDGIFLVFNCGPSVTQEDFDLQHSREIARVREILESHHIHFV